MELGDSATRIDAGHIRQRTVLFGQDWQEQKRRHDLAQHRQSWDLASMRPRVLADLHKR